MKCCLVTIAIGDSYLKEYNTIFRNSHEHYAKKCNYDFKVISDYIRPPRHTSLISFNKSLVCETNWETEYDFIIFVDSDIIINENSPKLHNYYDFGDKIGVVNQSQPNLEARLQTQIHKGFEVTASDYYKLKSGHTIETEHIINTGVLVIQPKKHREFFNNIFETYSLNQINNPFGFHYEQSVIGFEIQKNNLHYFMEMKWNALWGNNKYYFNKIKREELSLQKFYNDNFFIHLAGRTDFDKITYIKRYYLQFVSIYKIPIKILLRKGETVLRLLVEKIKNK